jgi:hypothetical protein
VVWGAPLGSGFTYQGRVHKSGVPVNDACDFEFSLFEDAGGVTQVGATQTILGVAVVDGLFTVELNSGVEFGPNAFVGDERFLEIAVKCPPDAGFTPLSPLQKLTAAPFAHFALNAAGGTGDGHSLDAADGDPVDALFVDNDGNVGIGTSSPSEKLDVDGSIAIQNKLNLFRNGDAMVWTNALTSYGTLDFYKTGDLNASVRLGHSNSPARAFTISTGDGTAGAAERLVVLSDGNVGIGTTDPAHPLHVVASSGASTRAVFGESTTFGETFGGYFQSASTSGTGVFGANTAGIGTTYGVRGQATSSAGYGGYFEGRGHFSGNVGIGAAPPGTRLDVRDASASSNVMNLQRESDASASADLLQMRIGAGSSDGTQFIECERGIDIKFRVWGDGDVTADGTYTSPADFAEMIRVTSGPESVESGDVMVIDATGARSVVKSTAPRSTLVAGVYSTKPGVLGSEHNWNDMARSLGLDPTSDRPGESLKPMELGRRIGEVPMAVVGIVPCKVSAENGPIAPGDLLVTSSTPGHGMRDANPRVGTVIGKALESLESGTGVIRVLVTLH